jgi:hypothetical protein
VTQPADEHPYTPHTFNEMHNTLSCHQMGGLHAADDKVRPVHMGIFQAKHLLEAGYRLIYDPEGAKALLTSGKEHGYA